MLALSSAVDNGQEISRVRALRHIVGSSGGKDS